MIKSSQLFLSVHDALISLPSFSIADSQKQNIATEFFYDVQERAKRFKNLNVANGDRVVITSGRGLDIWKDILAVWSLDASVVPISGDIATRDKDYILSLVNPKTVNFDAYTLHSENAPIENLLREKVSGPVGAVMFTSGSTGRPKGVVLSARAILENAQGTKERLHLDPEHKMLLPIACHFVSALSHMLVCSLSGTSLVINEGIGFPALLLQTVEKHNVNAVGGAPLHMRWISDLPSKFQFRWLMSSGDRLGGDLAIKLMKRDSNTQLRGVYGLTELGGRFCIADNDQLQERPATVGKTIRGLNLCIEDDGSGSGDVIVSGRTLMEGYLENMLSTPDFVPLSEFRTGDVGKKYGELLELNGRTDDVFKVSGLKVATPEVCEVMLRSGLFQDVYVTQVEHPQAGTVVGAFYTSAERDVPLTEILPLLRKSLPNHCIPRTLKRVTAIPRTGSGKINRHKMRSILEEEGKI